MKKKLQLLLFIALTLTAQTVKAQADSFIITLLTTTANETIDIRGQDDAISIDWGDGSSNNYSPRQIIFHRYSTSGEHNVSFTGNFTQLIFEGQDELTGVQQWGDRKWTSMYNMFSACYYLNSFPAESPNLSVCTNMSNMFLAADSFNQPIGNWDVSNVTNMEGMLSGARAFNQPIGNWNVSNVTNMEGILSGARTFNQPIGNWNVSKVSNMYRMFSYAIAFNQPIGNWDVSNVTDMSYMFESNPVFNQSLGLWNVRNVTNMSYMFYGTLAFNQPIGNWNVSNVTNMEGMFDGNPVFNQSLGLWNVSKVINMFGMFYGAIAFNQSIGSWDVRNVNNMAAMFERAKLPTATYDDILKGWANRGGLKQNVTLTVNSNYCSSETERNILKTTYGWIIDDLGKNCTSLGTEIYDEKSISLYPNPVSSVLNVKIDENIGNQTYTIIDVLGKIVLKGKLNEGTTAINIENLSKGLYVIKVANNNPYKFLKE